MLARLAVLLMLVLLGGPASAAVGHGRGGFPHASRSGAGRFDDRAIHHGHRGPEVFVFPYFYDPYSGYYPYDPGYPYDAYCDAYSSYYAPQYCYWDQGP